MTTTEIKRSKGTMHGRTRNALLALGFDTDLIDKIDGHHHTVDSLRSLSRPALLAVYAPKEVEMIQERIKRQPIPEDILKRVIEKADEACCFCADGNSARPYQIHHAEEYARTQNNTEDNLILICPTHHQSVPKHLPAEEQKIVRRNWHAVVEIAKAYRARGLDFPFGLFVAMDYGLQPRPAELIDGYRLSNGTALAASNHELAREGVALLRQSGLLPIVGRSGDGKTTLARGIAGHLWRDGYRVFDYQPPAAGRPLPLQDVLAFMHAADRPCVLILDDANRVFSETDLTQVSAVAGKPVFVLATWTRDYLSEDTKPERHLFNSSLVNWPRICHGVKSFLLVHEPEVVAAIQRHRDQQEPGRIGLGYLDTPLSQLIDRYEAEAKTVSEFLFLLRGGSRTVQTEIEVLADDSRSDIPVLYAAIEQISGFENPVTPEETANACEQVSHERGLPPPTTEWILDVFRSQVRRGRMQELRGAYKSVHRDWAARLIGAGLASARTRLEVERLLAPNLGLRAAEPMRPMRLCSWLWYDEHGGPHIRKWLSRQQAADWEVLVGNAVSKGLQEIGIVADRMHLLFSHDGWTKTVRAAFAPHEELLALAVASADAHDWFALRALAFMLEHACPDLAAQIIEQWEPIAAARLIETTDPDDYDTVTWVFSSYKKHSPAWVEQVGKNLRWEAISDNLRKVRTGNLDSVFQCERVIRLLRVPLLRSMVKRFANVIGDVVQDARLPDVRIGILVHPSWWMMFPEDMRQALDRLPASRIAKDLSNSRPRDWRSLGDLTELSRAVGSSFFADMIDMLDFDAFLAIVESQAVGNEYELRCLLWVLTRGREERRRVLASRLYSLVLLACQRSEQERMPLLCAFTKLDDEKGRQMLADTGTSPSSLEQHRKEVEGQDEPLDDEDEDEIRQFREQVASFDAANRDYIVDLDNLRLAELEES